MDNNVFLSTRNLTKSYGPVTVLDNVSIDFHKGEIHALIGENGAGKSTLCKMISGAIAPKSGKIIINDKEFGSLTPNQSKAEGVGMVYQEFNLIPELTIYENMFVGKEIQTGGFINKKKMIEKAKAVFEDMGIDIDCAKLVVSQGVKTVVDPTLIDCGRNPDWLKEISEKSELQIICTTGCYVEDISASGYWKHRMHCGDAVSEYAELLEAEVERGIRDTGIKAGLLKFATHYGSISDYQKMLIKGVVRAHKETGIPIYTHTEDGELAFEQAKLLLMLGCDPDKVIIGHMCGDIRIEKHLEVLKWGFNIGFDRIGGYDNHPGDKEKATVLSQLINLGYADKIVLSQDVICQRLGRPFEWPEDEKINWRNYHLGYIDTTFVPLLKDEYGVTEDEIKTLLIENPRRYFS